jgi:hypothetical protein
LFQILVVFNLLVFVVILHLVFILFVFEVLVSFSLLWIILLVLLQSMVIQGASFVLVADNLFHLFITVIFSVILVFI